MPSLAYTHMIGIPEFLPFCLRKTWDGPILTLLIRTRYTAIIGTDQCKTKRREKERHSFVGA
jgi:hypothetical protein